MSAAIANSEQVLAFVRAARHYARFIETAASMPIDERVSEAQRALLSLYGAATELPDVQPTHGSAMEEGWSSESVPWKQFERFEFYAVIFDSYDKEDAVTGSLSDDVLDVARDVLSALALWDSDELIDAVWNWRFTFETHWGQHAIDALSALHRATSRW